MRIKISILLLINLIYLNVHAQEMVLRFEQISDEEGFLKNSISGITQDKYGFMWIGTLSGLCRYDGYKLKKYEADASNPSAVFSDRIESLYKDAQGNIWIGYMADVEDIVCRYNYETDDFTRFYKKQVQKSIIDSLNRYKSIYHTYIKTDDYIWQVNQLFNPLSKNLPASQINNLLTQINRHNGNKIVYRVDPLNRMAISDEFVYIIYLDDNKLLWVGTANGGVNIADTKQNPIYHYYRTQQKDKSIIDNVIRAIYEDQNGNIWVGTQSKGVTKIETSTNKYIHYQYDENNPENSLINNRIRAIYSDKYGYIWIGTKAGLDRFDPKTNRFNHYSTVSKNKIPNDWIYCIMEDHNGNLWIGTFNGIAKYDRKRDKFIAYNVKYTSHNSRIRVILEDHNYNMWIATDGTGFARLKRDSAGGGDERISVVRSFVNNPMDSNSLSGNSVYSMLEDENGIFWLGTGAGLNRFDPVNETFQHFNKKNKLPTDLILGVLNDQKGHLWISHKNGLTRFGIKDYSIQNYTKEVGLQDNEFSEDAFFRNNKTGKLYFGGINGFNAFFPQDLKVNTTPPKTYITDFQIQNQSVQPNKKVNGHMVLNKPIYLTKEIKLNYLDNMITIEFAGLHYTNSKENKYAYMLEGFDKQWVYTNTSMRIAKYSNLEPGTYIFKVKSANCNGYWNPNPTTLKIIVVPPWWKTLLFKIIIVLLFIGMLTSFSFYRIYRLNKTRQFLENLVKERTKEIEDKNNKLINQADELNFKNALLEERQKYIESQADNLENLNYSLTQNYLQLEKQAHELNDTNALLEERQQMIEEQSEELLVQKESLLKLNRSLNDLLATKDKFFSIIAHDIKSPLGTIMGFTKMLLLKFNRYTDEKKIQTIEIILKSSNSLYQLLENLLEWSRSQSGNINFNPESIELEIIVPKLIELLKNSADAKEIEISFTHPKSGLIVFADQQMLNTVLRNLISNAIKFTHRGGKIQISAEMVDEMAMIKVADNGVGISAENKDKIFRIDKHHSTKGTEKETGTGLGLILSKEFVSKHGGEIGVESIPGEGSTFYFTLPVKEPTKKQKFVAI